MTDASDRRGFLAAMARRAAHSARVIAKEAGNPAKAISRYVDVEPEPVAAQARPEAMAPSRCASIDELCALAVDCSLAHRADALRVLAVKSIRLTPSAANGADGWLASDDVLSGQDAVDGNEQGLVGQFDLSSAALIGTPLARPGWLRLYLHEPNSRSDGPLPARAVLADRPEDVPVDGRPITAAAELALPRVWSAPVRDLSLEPTERDAYTDLRRFLADAQGVEHADDGGSRLAYHRLLGYPNETSGQMPAACAAAAGTDPARAHREWRLLAQISLAERHRLYFWTRSSALESGELEPLVAFRR